LNTINFEKNEIEDFVFDDELINKWAKSSTPEATGSTIPNDEAVIDEWIVSSPEPSQSFIINKEEKARKVHQYLRNVRKRLFIVDEKNNVCTKHIAVNCEECGVAMDNYEPAQKKIKMNMYVCIKSFKMFSKCSVLYYLCMCWYISLVLCYLLR